VSSRWVLDATVSSCGTVSSTDAFRRARALNAASPPPPPLLRAPLRAHRAGTAQNDGAHGRRRRGVRMGPAAGETAGGPLRIHPHNRFVPPHDVLALAGACPAPPRPAPGAPRRLSQAPVVRTRRHALLTHDAGGFVRSCSTRRCARRYTTPRAARSRAACSSSRSPRECATARPAPPRLPSRPPLTLKHGGRRRSAKSTSPQCTSSITSPPRLKTPLPIFPTHSPTIASARSPAQPRAPRRAMSCCATEPPGARGRAQDVAVLEAFAQDAGVPGLRDAFAPLRQLVALANGPGGLTQARPRQPLCAAGKPPPAIVRSWEAPARDGAAGRGAWARAPPRRPDWGVLSPPPSCTRLTRS